MRSDEAYEACRNGRGVGLEDEEAIINDDGVLCWKSSGMRVGISERTLYGWHFIEPEKPSVPETEEIPVTVNEFDSYEAYRKILNEDERREYNRIKQGR